MGLNLVSAFKDRFCEAIGDIPVTEFALLVGLSKQAISAYKNGTRKPKQPTIQVLSCTLGVNPDWLIGYDVPKFMKHASGGSMASVMKCQSLHLPPGCEELEKICMELNEEGMKRITDLAKDIVQIQIYKKGHEDFEVGEKLA